MLLLVGLGNPGPEYRGHRHNVGFMALDEIQRLPGFTPWSKKFQGETSEGEIAGRRVLLLKPLTFMNDSGRSVQAAAAFRKIPTGDVVVFHDELDLPPGKVRVKTGGGAGGHNGLRSIDQHLGRDYRRVRLGIGHPGSKERVTGHVLGDFAKSDQPWLDDLLRAVVKHLGALVQGEDAQFMNRVALDTGGSAEPEGAKGSAAAPKARAQSHIRQARGPKPALPATGPMAGMLKRLFGQD
ncbi:aminoacyl-tRNA hydrolase [Aureimonas sp. AU4]|uniref:aminoacyl-tRNA hydrolase n=1 Tax=Aureimonas sp. AU4 TaxID=1638163 RepID=UPI000780B411|nr:aminoacyl-tRNA hydrolase [Aureimonas sp. AU4]